MRSTPLTSLLATSAHNAVARRRIAALDPDNVYQHCWGESFYRHRFRRDVSLATAAASYRAATEQIIDRRQYHYDLEVVGKEGAVLDVRDVRGRERRLLDLVTNSYNDLDMLDEPRAALGRYVAEQPLSSCLSRKICGRYGVHVELEREVADFLGYDATVIGTCGYITQISTLFALFRRGDVIFSDQHNHSSLIDGMRLSGAKIMVYRHLDYDHLESLVRRHRRSFNVAGIVSDGVFSARASVVDMDRVAAIAERFNCTTVIDDTHGIGTIGRAGRGIIDLYQSRPHVLTGGFSKALGGFGGFAVSDRNLSFVIDTFGRQNINTSHLSPVAAAQSLINLRHYREHHGDLSSALGHVVQRFNSGLKRCGIAPYPHGERYAHPIFCFYTGRERDAIMCLNQLLDAGMLVSFFPQPVCPMPTLRVSLHRIVPLEEVDRLVTLLAAMRLTPEASSTDLPEGLSGPPFAPGRKHGGPHPVCAASERELGSVA